MTTKHCAICGDDIKPIERSTKLGINTCMACGDLAAKQITRCVVPMHKSNYVLITDPADLKGINNKGGFHNDQ